MVRFNLEQLVQEPEPHAAAQQDVSMDNMQNNEMELSIFQPSLSLEQQPTRQQGHEPLLARSHALSMDMHRPISRRMQGSPRTEFLASSEVTMHDAFRSRTMDMGIVKQRAPPVREAPRPTAPSYPAKPLVPLDSEEGCGNDMGLFLGRSFRVCFSPSGHLFMPCKNYSGGGGDGAGAYSGVHKVAALLLCGRAFTPRRYDDLLQKHVSLATAADAPGAGADELMAHVDKYVHGAGPGELGSMLRLVGALSRPDARSTLAGVSAWLQGEAGKAVARPLRGPSPLDDVFVLLSARKVDEACDVAVAAGNADLALLLSVAGEHTSLAQDMQAQVEWLERSERADLVHEGTDVEAIKLLHIYRLLSGDIDGLLGAMKRNFEIDPARVPGGKLLDWKRTLALYLWYAYPDPERMTLPPHNMTCSPRRDLFTSDAKLHLSLQGAVQYYLHQVWAADGNLVSHPWPAALESQPHTLEGAAAGDQAGVARGGAVDASSDRLRVRHAHVVRQLWRWEPESPSERGCPQMPSAVRSQPHTLNPEP